jgi:hypothetical protein
MQRPTNPILLPTLCLAILTIAGCATSVAPNDDWNDWTYGGAAHELAKAPAGQAAPDRSAAAQAARDTTTRTQ